MLGSDYQGLELREERWKCQCGMVERERERERDEICYFGEWEMEEWWDSEIWHFQNWLCLKRMLGSGCRHPILQLAFNQY